MKRLIKEIKEFIQDFQDYRLIRRLHKVVVINPTHANMIRSYNKEYEKELDSLVLWKLAEEMLSWEFTPDKYQWARLALMLRISFLWLSNHKFPIIKE